MTTQPTEAPSRGRRPSASRAPRHFPARYKMAIVREYETLDRRGKTALLRRKDLRASQVSQWRAQALAGALEALSAEPGSQPVHPVHASESLWQQFRDAAAAADPPFRPEQLIRAFLRYFAGLTDHLPPRPSPTVSAADGD